MVRARVFVGNIPSQVRSSDLKNKFSEFGSVLKCDLKGSYAFLEYDSEEDAQRAIDSMNDRDFKGQRLNVEMGGQIKRAKVPRDPHVKPGTIKLHVGGVGHNGDLDEFGNLFKEHTTVHQHHLMPNKDVGFVHVDEKSCEQVIEKMDGVAFNGGHMKIGYGQIGPKPRYDRNGPKSCLHVGGIVENATEKLIELKFGVFGSIGEVKFLPDKNIAFVEIQSQYADRCIEYLHGSLFYGKQIKVSHAKRKGGIDSNSDSKRSRRDEDYYNDHRDNRDDRYEKQESRSRRDSRDRETGEAQFVIDDFVQLSNQRPSVTIPTRYEIDSVVTKRRRLETLHPYERKLIEQSGQYELPPPPPEFLRLLRDRAELKSKCLLYQADRENRLHLLSTDQDDYGFSRPMTQQRRSPPPYRPAYHNYPPAPERGPAGSIPFNRGNDF